MRCSESREASSSFSRNTWDLKDTSQIIVPIFHQELEGHLPSPIELIYTLNPEFN
ncbi:hypothetical protein Cal6303_3895 [Calothrix sp. PCC 6303]|nr:hypothetical protein Cal6303_3895 [Calothrix sp. PCC 6303]